MNITNTESTRADRVILHCDCNSFFASVETVAHPEYKDVPMAVCGSKESRHGIVLAKNELAKKCGVTTGEVIWQAKKKCPSLVIAQPRYGAYEQFSREVNRIYYDYTDMIEPFGIDESWLDVTGSASLFGTGKKIADEIRSRVRSELGITVSAGVSFTKTFAKLGSDYKKPDATTVISRDTYKSLLFPLPVGDMMYIGRHTVPKLRMMGINTIGDLARADESTIVSFLGKTGKALYDACNGVEDSEVSSVSAPAKSYGNGMTFLRDLCGEDDFRKAVAFLSEKATARMRAAGAKCKVVSVSIRDTALSVVSKQKRLSASTSSAKTVEEVAMSLVLACRNINTPARSIQVACSDITDERNTAEQLCFFYTEDEERERKRESLDREKDRMRAIFGKGIIIRASFIGNDLGI